MELKFVIAILGEHFLISSSFTTLIIDDILKCSLPAKVATDSYFSKIASKIQCTTGDSIYVESNTDFNLGKFIYVFTKIVLRGYQGIESSFKCWSL